MIYIVGFIFFIFSAQGSMNIVFEKDQIICNPIALFFFNRMEDSPSVPALTGFP